jgi:hypothetical protein
MQQQHLPLEPAKELHPVIQSAVTTNVEDKDVEAKKVEAETVQQEPGSVEPSTAEEEPQSLTGNPLPSEGEVSPTAQMQEAEGRKDSTPTLSLEEHDRVLVQLRGQIQRNRRRRKRLLGLYGSGVIVFLIYVCFRMFGFQSDLEGMLGTMIGYGVMTLFAYFCALVTAVSAQRWSRDVNKILALEDVRTVGILAETLHYPDAALSAAMRKGLLRLLPRLQASDASLLNAEQRASLNRVLPTNDHALVLAILRAWQQVGDGEAIPAVEPLAAGESVLAQRSPEIQQAAQDCLPFLRLRAEWERIGGTLLRAAEAPTTDPATLLRSIEDATMADSGEHLLRPTE